MPPMFRAMLIGLLGTFSIIYASYASSLELVPHTAAYSTNIDKGISLNGDAIRELKKIDGKLWEYRFDVDSSVAEINEHVIFELHDDRIRALDYHYLLDGFWIPKREQSVAFDWTVLRAKGSHKKKKWLISMPDNAIDRLGYQLQLLMDFYPQNNTMTFEDRRYPIVHKGKIRPSRFSFVKEEVIETVLGKTPAVLVEKVRDKGKDRVTKIWLSKEHPFLLLKMFQSEPDGEKYEIFLKSANINGVELP